MEPRMDRHPLFFVTDILVAIAAALTLLALPYQAGTAVAATDDAAPAAAAVTGGSGLRVHIDPRTGELLDEPPPGSETDVGTGLKSTGPALVEEPSPVAGGGTMIRLDDRFRADFRAEVGPDGKLVTDCQQPAESR